MIYLILTILKPDQYVMTELSTISRRIQEPASSMSPWASSLELLVSLVNQSLSTTTFFKLNLILMVIYESKQNCSDNQEPYTSGVEHYSPTQLLQQQMMTTQGIDYQKVFYHWSWYLILHNF